MVRAPVSRERRPTSRVSGTTSKPVLSAGLLHRRAGSRHAVVAAQPDRARPQQRATRAMFMCISSCEWDQVQVDLVLATQTHPEARQAVFNVNAFSVAPWDKLKMRAMLATR